MCGIFLGEKTQKARKQHRCAACSVVIPKGFQYVRSCDVVDDKAHTTKWHVECLEEFCRTLRVEQEDCGDAWMTWENGMPEEFKAKYEKVAQ